MDIGFLLTKLLPLFVYPLGVAILLGIVAALLVWKRKRRSGLVAVVASVVMLWVCATPEFSRFVRGSLESEFPLKSVDEAPAADAIVVLSGRIGMVDSSQGVMALSDRADRLFHAFRLFAAEKAPVLILSGGGRAGTTPEAEVMAIILSEWGVPRNAMLLETRSRNTYQNAVNTRAILVARGIKKVLLVTSAFHMRRALATFRALEVDVVPAPADYEEVGREFGILDWLPNAEALYRTTYSVNEYLGYVVYWLRGQL